MKQFHARYDREDGLVDTLTIRVTDRVVYWQGNLYEEARAMHFCCVPILRSFLLREESPRDMLRILTNRYTFEFTLTSDGGCDYCALDHECGMSFESIKINGDAVRGLIEYLTGALLTYDPVTVSPDATLVPVSMTESGRAFQVVKVHNCHRPSEGAEHQLTPACSQPPTGRRRHSSLVPFDFLALFSRTVGLQRAYEWFKERRKS